MKDLYFISGEARTIFGLVELEASEHPMKDKAIENLNKLYKGMK